MSDDRFVTIMVDRAEMARRGRIGGYVTAARHDSREQTAKARQVFRDRFLIEVDPDGTLSVEERTRRAEAARKAHYARMAAHSVASRARRASADTPKAAKSVDPPEAAPPSRPPDPVAA